MKTAFAFGALLGVMLELQGCGGCAAKAPLSSADDCTTDKIKKCIAAEACVFEDGKDLDALTDQESCDGQSATDTCLAKCCDKDSSIVAPIIKDPQTPQYQIGALRGMPQEMIDLAMKQFSDAGMDIKTVTSMLPMLKGQNENAPECNPINPCA